MTPGCQASDWKGAKGSRNSPHTLWIASGRLLVESIMGQCECLAANGSTGGVQGAEVVRCVQLKLNAFPVLQAEVT